MSAGRVRKYRSGRVAVDLHGGAQYHTRQMKPVAEGRLDVGIDVLVFGNGCLDAPESMPAGSTRFNGHVIVTPLVRRCA